jgi:metal-sulfur cluster biosynthetic enzyme
MKTLQELSSANEFALRDTLLKIADPEIGENIVDLGLIYGVETDDKSIVVAMTMTSPACPMGEMLLDEVHAELLHAFPDAEIDLRLVWEPAWDPDMMSARAKENLGWE